MKKQSSNQAVRTITANKVAIPLVPHGGQWWVPIKPICEALDVDYQRAHKNLLADEDLQDEHALVAVPNAKGGQSRQMVCLPHLYVFGWMFELRSAKPAFKKWRKACYKLLYEAHTGGSPTDPAYVQRKAELAREYHQLAEAVKDDPKIKRMKAIKDEEGELDRKVSKQTKQLIADRIQLDMFAQQNHTAGGLG